VVSLTNSLLLHYHRTYQPSAIKNIPATRREVAEYIIDNDVSNIAPLFDYQKSTQMVKVRKDARRASKDFNYRCLGTRKLVGDGWVVTDCSKRKPIKGFESFSRHLKSVHLGLGRGPKASLDLPKWAKGVHGNSMTVSSYLSSL
jgi:hypothetical protein